MNQRINQEMEILWSDFADHDLDEKLAAFDRLNAIATVNDLPQLIQLLKSDRNGFWERELLSEPITTLGGVKYIPELFEALELNRIEGYDNDLFHHFLTEMAGADPSACKQALEKLLSKPNYKHRMTAEWLLGFCK